MTRYRSAILLGVLIVALSGCGAPGTGAPPTNTPQPSIFCPVATPEVRSIRPVVSPTTSLTQTIALLSTNMARIEVDTESGYFVADGNSVEITLLPNVTHHLKVRGTVKTFPQSNGCPPYGGYTLDSTTGQDGKPLIIVQGTGVATPPASRTPTR